MGARHFGKARLPARREPQANRPSVAGYCLAQQQPFVLELVCEPGYIAACHHQPP